MKEMFPMRKMYPSDITQEQFAQIAYHFESFRKSTRPRKYAFYDIFCAVLYILKQGCTWRALPHDFPEWRSVYNYFKMWSRINEITGISLLDKIMRELVASERVLNGRNPKTSMIIIDSKSIKNADTAEEKGYDAGKKLQA
jgi:transposase